MGKQTIKVKDCEIISFRCGSRLQNSPEWAYRVVYNAPSGKSVTLKKVFYTKAAAREYISKVVAIANELKDDEVGAQKIDS